MWIEIAIPCVRNRSLCVTPRAGVWIEISTLARGSNSSMSLPVRECGLKFCRKYGYKGLDGSLPVRECGLKSSPIIASVGWATSLPVRECGLKSKQLSRWKAPATSLPVRECGLKSDQGEILSGYLPSLPVRECGLKWKLTGNSRPGNIVTPRAGVWIEMTSWKQRSRPV